VVPEYKNIKSVQVYEVSTEKNLLLSTLYFPHNQHNPCNYVFPRRQLIRRTNTDKIFLYEVPYVYITVQSGHCWEGDEWCGHPAPQSTRGGKMGRKMDSLNEKQNIDFYALNRF
jgi:hypothetical protein